VSTLFNGKLQVLVSNVGFNIRKPTVDFTPDEYRRLMDTNLEATFAVRRGGCFFGFFLRSSHRFSDFHFQSLAAIL
jgi:NAD(P)-dependent dehydrogenase (short-subunit alcohol dehydrogenase family)